jgi:hypothetical protein
MGDYGFFRYLHFCPKLSINFNFFRLRKIKNRSFFDVINKDKSLEILHFILQQDSIYFKIHTRHLPVIKAKTEMRILLTGVKNDSGSRLHADQE